MASKFLDKAGLEIVWGKTVALSKSVLTGAKNHTEQRFVEAKQYTDTAINDLLTTSGEEGVLDTIKDLVEAFNAHDKEYDALFEISGKKFDKENVYKSSTVKDFSTLSENAYDTHVASTASLELLFEEVYDELSSTSETLINSINSKFSKNNVLSVASLTALRENANSDKVVDSVSLENIIDDALGGYYTKKESGDTFIKQTSIKKSTSIPNLGSLENDNDDNTVPSTQALYSILSDSFSDYVLKNIYNTDMSNKVNKSQIVSISTMSSLREKSTTDTVANTVSLENILDDVLGGYYTKNDANTTFATQQNLTTGLAGKVSTDKIIKSSMANSLSALADYASDSYVVSGSSLEAILNDEFSNYALVKDLADALSESEIDSACSAS